MKQRDNWHLTDEVAHESGRGDPFAAAVRATRMPMVVTDPAQDDNPIVFVNEAFQQLTGYGRDEIIGRNCRFLQGPETDRDAVRRVREAIARGEAINIDLLNYRKDGTTFWNALSLSPVRNDDGEISFFFASQLDMTDRVAREADLKRQREETEAEVRARTEALQSALAAKDLLLHEVDHRVKNNLTMIGSLIRLQMRDLKDPEVVARLDAMLERVDALATVHRRLYQSDDLTAFDIGAFVRELAADVIGSSGRDDLAIATDVEIERLTIASSHASAVGLALNEIITNAVKHGFRDGRSGTLRVSVEETGGAARITIADDGHGLPEEPRYGLGRTLVQRLARQVGGSVAWERGEPGTIVTLSVPVSAA